jgi:DNA-binding MarR family transcriptional regulator
VDRVERRRLVERCPDPHDRRACNIALTSEGARLGYQSHDRVIQRLALIISETVSSDTRRVASVLARLVAGGESQVG